MIESFAHKGLKRFYTANDPSGISPEFRVKIQLIFDALDSAKTVDDLDLPGFHLHQLTGKLKNHWSIRVNKNWRIVFRFQDENAYDVNLVDYH